MSVPNTNRRGAAPMLERPRSSPTFARCERLGVGGGTRSRRDRYFLSGWGCASGKFWLIARLKVE